MALTFRSTRPQRFTLLGEDEYGRERVCVAEKNADDWNWSLRLVHPSGEMWEGAYSGRAILDAMSEMVAARDPQFIQDRENGDRPREVMRRDGNRSVDDSGNSMAPDINFWRKG
jgi:hypothetical protein